MAAIYVVEHEDCIKEAVEVLKKCRHRCSKTRKSKIAANFKCWVGNCLRSKIRTKWTCRVRPNQFENRIIAVDELSSSKMLKGLIVVKFNCLVLAQCIAALNIKDVIDHRVVRMRKGDGSGLHIRTWCHCPSRPPSYYVQLLSLAALLASLWVLT